MSKVLKRLYLGDVVKSFGTKQLRKLTTEEPQEESVIGTWVFNENVDFSMLTNLYDRWYIDFISSDVEFDSLRANKNVSAVTYEQNLQNYYSAYTNGEWQTNSLRTIIINGGDDVNNATFVSWLKANATKQESIVGTWVFKDTLTIPTEAEVGVSYSYHVFYTYDTNGSTFTTDRMGYHVDNSGVETFVFHTLQSNDAYRRTVYYFNDTDNTSKGWVNEEFKTIKISKDPENENFTTWLKANATKIA